MVKKVGVDFSMMMVTPGQMAEKNSKSSVAPREGRGLRKIRSIKSNLSMESRPI
jgi:hypothetical protein